MGSSVLVLVLNLCQVPVLNILAFYNKLQVRAQAQVDITTTCQKRNFISCSHKVSGCILACNNFNLKCDKIDPNILAQQI